MRVGIGGISSVSKHANMSKVHSESIKHYQHHHRFFFSASFRMLSLFLSTSTSVANFAHLKNGLEKFFLDILPIFFHQQLSLNYFSKLELMSEVSDITHFPLYHCHTLYPKVIQSCDLFFVGFLLITWWCISCCNFLPLRIRKYCLFSGSNF